MLIIGDQIIVLLKIIITVHSRSELYVLLTFDTLLEKDNRGRNEKKNLYTT